MLPLLFKDAAQLRHLVEYLLVKKVNEIKEKACDTYRESSKVTNDSLKSEGQLTPVVVTSDYTLVDGYRRLNLLSELGSEPSFLDYSKNINH